MYLSGIILIMSTEVGEETHLLWIASSLGCVSGEREQIGSLHSMLSASGCGCDATSCFELLPL